MAGPSRIDELRKKFDENPRRYFAPLANEYRKIGDFEQAIFICQEFLPQQPGHMSGHIVYGQALFESGRHDEARSVFETALALDPENLIALRHLGDIARAIGDNETARAWYRRVLESDPRNEEIAGILNALDADTGSASESAAPVAPSAPAAELAVEKSIDESVVEVSVPPAGSTDPIVSEPLTSAPAESSFDDIAKLFTSAPAETSSPPAQEPVVPGASGAFTFFHEGEDVLGRAAQMAEPTAQNQRSSSAARSLDADSPLSGLSTFGEQSNSPPASTSSFLEGLTASEPPVAPEQPKAPEAKAPTPAAQPPAAATTAFVTETMAELYVQQGHVDRALDVYRQLVAMKPDDATLASRLRELERPGHAPINEPAADAAAERVAEEIVAEAGPTIRDFLVGIAGFRVNAASSSNDVTVQATTSVPAPLAQPEVPRARATEETLGGSLHNLFAGAESDAARRQSRPMGDLQQPTEAVPSADIASRSSEESATIPGRPATPAATELSLDHVFRHATPAAGTGTHSSFSFDQFFSQQAQQDVGATNDASSAEGGSGQGDDIQQFNAWLEGLKKT
jgi:tetratricopeptide (TPR) repeat protein